MTSPQEQADALGDRLVAIERAAERQALGDTPEQLEALLRQAMAAAQMSPVAWQAVAERIVALLEPVGPAGSRAVASAIAAGWQEGLASVAASIDRPEPVRLDVPEIDNGVQRIVDEQIAGARASLRSNEEIPVAVAIARRTVHRVRAANTWHVNSAAGRAVTGAAQELGLHRRWVAERDACLHCLAYQGEVSTPDGSFRGGLTFADRPHGIDPVEGTPLHPFCRCVIQVHDPADGMVIEALKREARRSVAKGWSMPSESEKARLRATSRLLASGARLPKTVEKAAERAVKRGSFLTRNVP